MDPDWIFKNPLALEITFTADTSAELDFSVTDVISINSTTNAADSIYPVIADSSIPTFIWTDYPNKNFGLVRVCLRLKKISLSSILPIPAHQS